jgi:hypothetical protein
MISEYSGKRGGTKGPRICVLDKTRLQYHVFTIVEKIAESSEGKSGDEGDDVQMTQ